MSTYDAVAAATKYLDDPHYIEETEHKLYGFWLYLMSDCVLFATLFTTFAIFSMSVPANQTAHTVISLPNTALETACLLTSTFTYGLARVALDHNRQKPLIIFLLITFVLGMAFVGLELHEFYDLIKTGYGPDQNVYLSAFFSLVGTHGLHVTCGLIWMAFMIKQILQKGLLITVRTRVKLLGLFWHFLDIIWIGIFSFVYLVGSL